MTVVRKQTGLLKTKDICFLPILEVRSLKLLLLGWNHGVNKKMLSPETLRENLFRTSSSYSWLLAFHDLWLSHSSLCLLSHIVFSSMPQIFFSFLRTFVIAFRAHIGNMGLFPHLKILYLSTSTKNPFSPYKVTVIGFKD